MRPIKFRAWDKGTKTLCNVTCLEWEEGGRFRKFSNIILLQYTGLHDKNSVEIYEGDILKHSYYFDYGQWGELKTISTPVEVKWMGTSFSPFQGWSGYGQQLETCEVIGNIYENKELLK